MLRPFVHLVACFARAQSLKPVKLLSQQLPTFLLFRDRRSVAQQFWIRLRSFSNIVEATHSHYALSPKSYRSYPSHDALQVPTLLGVVVSVCTPLPTRTQQFPTYPPTSRWSTRIPLSVPVCKMAMIITTYQTVFSKLKICRLDL